MQLKKLTCYFYYVFILLMACNTRNDVPLTQLGNSYQLDENWPQLPPNFLLGNPTGISIDTNKRVLVFHRADRTWPLNGNMPKTFITAKTVLILDSHTGKLLDSWGDNMFIMPHGLKVDNQNYVWLTDVALHQVFKFTIDGKLLMTLGEANKAGNDSAHFNMPTDVGISKDGCFYVSDGYGNSRVIKFSAEGKYLFEWGTKGTNKGEFDIPHGVTLDDSGNVYVADRENKRVQVFDSSGKFLAEWNDKSMGRICSLTYDHIEKKIIATDDLTSLFNLKHHGSDVIWFSESGVIQGRLGRSGNYKGPACWYHAITIDDEENIYVGDILGNRIQKFMKQKIKASN